MMVLLTAYLKGGWLFGPVLVSLISDLRIVFCLRERIHTRLLWPLAANSLVLRATWCYGDVFCSWWWW